jgi:hypothetical protein
LHRVAGAEADAQEVGVASGSNGSVDRLQTGEHVVAVPFASRASTLVIEGNGTHPLYTPNEGIREMRENATLLAA